MKAKRILYITPGLNTGGAEKFLITLSAGLREDAKSQCLVSLTDVNVLQPELDKTVRFIALSRKSRFDLSPIKQLRKIIQEEKPDLVFCINFFAWFMYRIANIGTRSNAQRIISYHTTFHVSKKEYWLHKFYTSLLTKKDLIVTVSNNQAAFTAKQMNIPARKFKTIYNGIDTGYWSQSMNGSANKTRIAYNIPADAKVIIKAAAFRVEKNHAGAVKALHILHNRYGLKAHLLLLGEGKMMPDTKKLVAELGMQDYISFAGLQRDLRPFYQASDLFTLCSTNVETFSIAALEAMASGLPMVLTRIGGASEMISEDNGFLCEPTAADIAEKWHKALIINFDRSKVHAYVRSNFGSHKMIEEYKKIL
jgi:glycosyltransferase involved in cell wall biosynthesis